jgi:hypothetical protein
MSKTQSVASGFICWHKPIAAINDTGEIFAPQGLPYIEHKANLAGIAIASNPSGAGVGLWRESYNMFDGNNLFRFPRKYAVDVLIDLSG